MNYFNYFSEIESAFIRRRGRNLLLSPLDWALIESWQEREVPLHIILRGIEKVFDGVDKQPARKRIIKSLTFCREEIEAQYSEWLESQIGKNGNSAAQDSSIKTANFQSPPPTLETGKENLPENENLPDETVAAHFEKITGELQAAKSDLPPILNETLKTALKSLEKLRKDFSDAETLEKDLEKLDAVIDEKLLQTCRDEKLKDEIKQELTSYRSKMDAEIYRRTFDLMILKRLREQTKIPRFSLFYL